MTVLGIAFVVSQFAAGQGIIARATTSPALVSAPAPTTATAPTPISSTATSPTAATAAPSTATPTPSPSTTPDPLTATAYSNSGRRYAALRAPVGYTYRAPFAGTVQIRMYQLIEGEVRVGSNVTSLPFFPYITLESADRRIVYRPGALNADTELLAKDGERAEPGTALFKTVGEGASSWRTFYDRGMTANVILSVAQLPGGAELDPIAFLAKP